ncbi:Double-stranded RNA-specific editase B2 [Blomia tropicalis]|nr:Double-stranded RNA-specific editase B2 [Blomia tropicalis]
MSVETFPTWNQMQNGKQVASFMTCSDKILMWNVCGVQGSILAKFIEPIYIDNVIINSKQTSIETVKKLLYGRLNQQKMNDKLKQCKSFGYQFKCNTIHYYKPENHDQIFNSSLDKKSPKAYNWYKIIGKVGMIETINSQTGTLHGNEQHHSQLSKRSFLAQYLSLPKPLLNSTNNEPNPMNGLFWSRMKRTYRGIKEQSIQYQLVKKEFIDTVKESGLGQWIQVDVSIDLFVADLPSLE